MIFEKVDQPSWRRIPGAAGASVVAHLLFILLVLALSVYKKQAEEEKAVEVKFVAAHAPAPPPPPAAPAKAKRPRRQPTRITKIELPKVILPPRPIEEAPPPEDDEDDGVEGGVEGGVVGGMVGGTGTGPATEAPPPPPPPEKPKAKNVPPFVIDRDLIRKPLPRMGEVFKQAHRGETLTGMYRVCVGLDGKVYEVTPIKGVPGADEEIVGTIREEWLYKPQQVPVCFMYAFNIQMVQ